MVNLKTATSCTDEEIAEVMNFKPWSAEQVEKGVVIRTALGHALKAIIQTVKPGEKRDTAIRKILEARMDCNASITFEDEDDEPLTDNFSD